MLLIFFFNCLILPLFDFADIIWGYNDNAVLANNLQLLLNKAAKTILSRIKSLLLIFFFNCLILPLFDFADIIWGYNDNAVLANNLQLLLNKAAKTILTTALFIHLHATDALEALGWLALQKRRLFLRCLYLYKCVNETSAHSMDLLANKDLHGYDTQHKDNLRLPRVGRNWGKQRTHYQAAKDWNSLDLCLRNQITSSL